MFFEEFGFGLKGLVAHGGSDGRRVTSGGRNRWPAPVPRSLVSPGREMGLVWPMFDTVP